MTLCNKIRQSAAVQMVLDTVHGQTLKTIR